MWNRSFPFIVLLLFFGIWMFTRPARAEQSPVPTTGDLYQIVQDMQRQMIEMRRIVAEQSEQIAQLKQEKDALPVSAIPGPSLTAPIPSPLMPLGKEEENRFSDFLKQDKTLVKVGRGSLKVGGLLQGWYVVDDLAADTFRLRRGEIKLYGQIVPQLDYLIQFDPTKELKQTSTGTIIQDSRSLKDLYFDFKYIPHHVFRMGQFKPPITEEGPRSSGDIDTIERAFITNTFGDVREMGAMITGNWEPILYQGAIFNGQDSNTLAVKDKKDFAGRIVLRPPIKGLEFGGSGYIRTSDPSEKKRIAAEARYAWDQWTLKSEYATGQTGAAVLYGWYAQATYLFTPKIQGVFKFDRLDRDTRVALNRENDVTLGLNWFLDGNYAKLQLNYVLRDREDGLDIGNQVLGAIQVKF